jgi:hypothetical protein
MRADMNTKLTLLTIVALALPLGLLAQAKDEPKSQPDVSPGRAAIIKKLETIRLDSVRFEGLPLGEVVVVLRDEAKKRDPEKKGINFMFNPNQPTELAPSPVPVLGPDGTPLPVAPVEAVDINSITINVNPPLDNVRLADVLDAVVKVADRPIKFTIEDYGVVFALRGPESPRPEANGFTFPGGSPSDFLHAVQRQFKADWASVADIPPEMADVRIPKLRITRDSLGNAEEPALQAVVTLYNQLGAQKPNLGRLIVQGDLTRPSVVMFVPDKSAAVAQPIKVKAFSVYGIRQKSKLRDAIEEAKRNAVDYAAERRGSSGSRSMDGSVAIHDETSLLVATGPESFVEMVESIVDAWRIKERADDSAAPMATPNPPGK